MACAGDGAPRSDRRRMTASISLRMEVDDKSALEAQARRAGYPTLSAWISGRLLEHDGHVLPRRDRMVAIGRLGQIGSRITQIRDEHPHVLPSTVLDGLQSISDDITALQRDLFR